MKYYVLEVTDKLGVEIRLDFSEGLIGKVYKAGIYTENPITLTNGDWKSVDKKYSDETIVIVGCLEATPVLPRGPNLNVGTNVPLYFTAFGRKIKPPALRVVIYFLTLGPRVVNHNQAAGWEPFPRLKG